MEDVNFLWVLHSLSQRSCIIPILDTVVLKDDKIIAQYTMFNKVLTKLLPSDSQQLLNPVTWIISQYSILNKLRKSNDIACYMITKNIRTAMTFKELKDFSNAGSQFNKPNLIQIAKPQLFREQKTFIYKLVFNAQGYNSSLYLKTDKGLTPSTSPDFYEKSKDIGRMMVLYLEEAKHVKILELSIELLTDDYFQLWIGGVTECRVIDICEINIYHINSAKDLQSIPLKKKKTLKISGKKLFCRSENARLPIIISPDFNSSIEIIDEEICTSKQESFDTLLLVRRNSIVKKEPKKKKGEAENEEKFKDFVEILSKTMLKLQRDSTGKLPTDEDMERESKRIGSILSPDVYESRHPSICINDYGLNKAQTKNSISSRKIFYNSKSNPGSRKNSEAFYGNIINSRVRKVIR